MTTHSILVTGGAGFIGSHLVDALIEKGHSVTILDCLDPQVHGQDQKPPSFLNKQAKFIQGDVRDRDVLEPLVKESDIIFHEAAAVGVGQSMYQIKHYMDVNTLGTAQLLDILVNTEHNVKKLMVAASMSSYGEGLYTCDEHGDINPPLRPESQLKNRDWEMKCPHCGNIAKAKNTPETKAFVPNSVYAISKQDQEQMVLNVCETYGLPAVSLRYFNVYGPRQSLSNPYTGVAAIFMSRIKNDHAPIVFEDGLQSRDFISVHDIVRANIMVMESAAADYEMFNVGTGRALSVLDVAKILIKLYNKDLTPDIKYSFRKGDIRHCISDSTKIYNKVGFKAQTSFEEGMKELVEWGANQESVDMVDKAVKELEMRGLTTDPKINI